VIKHTDYTEYVREDLAALLHINGIRVEDGQHSTREREGVSTSMGDNDKRGDGWPAAAD
jgi:hypothetical protein